MPFSTLLDTSLKLPLTKKRRCIRGFHVKNGMTENASDCTKSWNISRMQFANLCKQKEKQYKALNCKKKRHYILEKEKSDLLTFIKNPRKGWRQVKGQKKKVIGSISDDDMLEFVTRLYNHDNITIMDSEEMVSYICAELLKWTKDRAREKLSYVLTYALHHGFPLDWQENWVQPLLKGRDKKNYQTIMISSTLAKLFNTLLKEKNQLLGKRS